MCGGRGGGGGGGGGVARGRRDTAAGASSSRPMSWPGAALIHLYCLPYPHTQGPPMPGTDPALGRQCGRPTDTCGLRRTAFCTYGESAAVGHAQQYEGNVKWGAPATLQLTGLLDHGIHAPGARPGPGFQLGLQNARTANAPRGQWHLATAGPILMQMRPGLSGKSADKEQWEGARATCRHDGRSKPPIHRATTEATALR